MSNETIQSLFSLANDAKSICLYEVANKVFCILSHMKLKGETSLRFIYEWQGEEHGDLIENLANSHTTGYYDLPAVADFNGNHLCIPLPLLSRYFMNRFVMSQPEFVDRMEHNRECIEMEEAEETAFIQSLHDRMLAFSFGFSVDAVCALFLETEAEETVNESSYDEDEEPVYA